MVALDASPVIGSLELIFFLGQRAIATAHVEAISESAVIVALVQAVSIEEE